MTLKPPFATPVPNETASPSPALLWQGLRSSARLRWPTRSPSGRQPRLRRKPRGRDGLHAARGPQRPGLSSRCGCWKDRPHVGGVGAASRAEGRGRHDRGPERPPSLGGDAADVLTDGRCRPQNGMRRDAAGSASDTPTLPSSRVGVVPCRFQPRGAFPASVNPTPSEGLREPPESAPYRSGNSLQQTEPRGPLQTPVFVHSPAVRWRRGLH